MRKARVLIIEDETDICYLLSNILKAKDMETSFVTSLRSAHESLRLFKPDIVFIDNHLPDGFGMDYIPFMKRNFPASKVVMLTAYDTPSEKNLAIHRGADMFLGKPFTKDLIYSTVDGLLFKKEPDCRHYSPLIIN
jgi:two-component system, OmpR family, response regulator